MKANELRLGSFFGYKGCIYAANVIRDNFVYGKNVNGFASGEFPLDKINPIPLTEEWLLKFGFEKVGKTIFLIGNFKVTLKDNVLSFRAYYYKINLKSIHELQNLYFVLAGKELTI